MSFHMNGRERPCRTEVFACSASDAPFFIYGRDHERLRVVRILADHPDGSGRTVACAVAAFHSVSVHYAAVEIDYRVADLDR